MKENTIISVGENAVSSKDNMIILFDETATDDIKNVAVIHQPINQEVTYQLSVGTTIKFGEQCYAIEEMGERVNGSLTMMGHATLLFKERSDEDLLPNALYLSPYNLPEIKTGMSLIFD
ncbi:PTS glucitol/sorbitol transporter subunit IIA [Vagococcus xieshaowenii]|uniref:PTS sorbitol transporter subunit IIA n=1 Tax=Vagococcus xieshaowenii TaxID=2562451 RepID=A0A4Z0D5R6_9ENTE|nr:PTS glucitol/sorbitol transporter subunit IIA [Vagococcus xieshaowenii]QCA28128.1 PTS sorbitol transporter subunit IIA [Vagococcus xieshaowenii]TFZ40172.1 PTS sorbitol transporter subunit IIA [Vagococcus xieshaowenii]